MTDINGRVVVLTGAASGIGRGLAKALAAEGALLDMADKDEAGLADTLSMLPDGADAVPHVLDVSSRDGWDAWAADIQARRGHADIIINNAGVTLAARARDMTHEDLEWLMGINFWGVVYGTKAFLPQMLQRDSGHIVNVSSVFGLFGVRTQSAYCASKFAVRGYSEAVRVELDGTGVRMSVVHPGGIQTRIAHNLRYRLQGPDAPTQDEMAANFAKQTPTTADEAAAVVIKGIQGNNPRILIGRDAKLIDVFSRLMPVSFPIRTAKRASLGGVGQD